jgi:murein DD-endopeptidase MepM/ murein hydrolase activator NlpD
MKGSVLVRPGDRVQAGQPLACVGNSGNTTEPHLHIHAKRGDKPDSILDGEGMPMRFGGRWLIRNSVVRSAWPATSTGSGRTRLVERCRARGTTSFPRDVS